MTENRSFCVLPWMHMAANSSGVLRLCCNSTPGKNMILDDNGKPFRLDHTLGSMQTVYNSEWMKSIRRSMRDGEKISICQRCYTEEDAGVRSARESWNEKYGQAQQQMLSETQSDGGYDFKPKYIDLRLGNLCNLKCRMCNPYASRKWLEDWDKIASLDALAPSESKRLSGMDWFKSENFVNNLMSVLDSVEEIYFTGGEPLLINKHFDLLDVLIREKRARRVVLKYNTNMTFIPEKVFSLWSQFKKVVLNASIDGVGAVNDYIRNPSQWSEVKTNLLRMDDFLAQTPNVEGSIHTTVQMYNLEHLIELLDFVGTLKGFKAFPYLNILNHPPSLNIRNAPINFKAEITKELTRWQQENSEALASQHQFKKMQGMIDYLNSHDMDLYGDFLKYTSEIDNLRSENFSTICPRLSTALLQQNPSRLGASGSFSSFGS